MAIPHSRGGGAHLFIGDTGALMNDVVWAARSGRLSSLLAALHHDAALMYIPRHVLVEVERDLPVYAQKVKRPVNPDLAVSWWRRLYAPCIRVVDVPPSWGIDDPNVQAVTDRHAPDRPTAQLALALFPCYILAKDNDLTDNDFGRHDHLPLLLAAANEGELSYTNKAMTAPVVVGGLLLEGAVYGFRRLPALARIGLVVATGLLVNRWHHDGRLAGGLRQAFRAIGTVASVVAPLLQQIHQRIADNEAVWSEHLPRLTRAASVSEQVARILAYAPEQGMLASDVARELNVPGSVKAHRTVVRHVLCDCPAFTEVSRGRFRLGQPAGDLQRSLPPTLSLDWMRRAHRSLSVLRHKLFPLFSMEVEKRPRLIC